MTRLYLTLFVALAIAVSYISMAHADVLKPAAPRIRVTPKDLDIKVPASTTSTTTSSQDEAKKEIEFVQNGEVKKVVVKITKKLNATGGVEYTSEVFGCEECSKSAGGKLEEKIVGTAATSTVGGITAVLDEYIKQRDFAPKSSAVKVASETVAVSTDDDEHKKETDADALSKAKEKLASCEIRSYRGNPIVEKKFDDKKDPTARIKCYADLFTKSDTSKEKDPEVMAKLKKVLKKFKPAYLKFKASEDQDETLDTAYESALDALEDTVRFDSISAEASHIRAIALSNRQTKIHDEMMALGEKFVADRNQNQYAAANQDAKAFATKFAEFQEVNSDLKIAGADYHSALNLSNSNEGFNRHSSISRFSDPADANIDSVVSDPFSSIVANNKNLTSMHQQLALMNRNGGNRTGGAGFSNNVDIIAGLDSNQNWSAQNNRTVSQNGVTFNRGLDSQGNEILSRGTPTATYSATPPIINLFPGGAQNWQQSRTPGTGALAMSTVPQANTGQFINGVPASFPASSVQSNGAVIQQGRGMALPRG